MQDGQITWHAPRLEARRFVGDIEGCRDALAAWSGGRGHRPAEMDDDGWCSGDPVIDLPDDAGRVRDGDWILRDAHGQFMRLTHAAAQRLLR